MSVFEERFNAAEQSCHAVALWHDCGNAQGLGRRLTKRVVKHCVEDNGSAGHSAAKEERDFDTIRVGHGKVQNDQVGTEEDGFVECFRAVSRFANFKLRTALNKGAYGASYGGLIVGDENASGHG